MPYKYGRRVGPGRRRGWRGTKSFARNVRARRSGRFRRRRPIHSRYHRRRNFKATLKGNNPALTRKIHIPGSVRRSALGKRVIRQVGDFHYSTWARSANLDGSNVDIPKSCAFALTAALDQTVGWWATGGWVAWNPVQLTHASGYYDNFNNFRMSLLRSVHLHFKISPATDFSGKVRIQCVRGKNPPDQTKILDGYNHFIDEPQSLSVVRVLWSKTYNFSHDADISGRERNVRFTLPFNRILRAPFDAVPSAADTWTSGHAYPDFCYFVVTAQSNVSGPTTKDCQVSLRVTNRFYELS